MSVNKKVIETYLTTTDRAKLAPMLADNVEWIEWGDGVPASGARTRGKAAFIANSGDDELRTQIVRMTEEDNVVVAEGLVSVHKKDGRVLKVRFVDIFELEHGQVKRLNSFGALINDSAEGIAGGPVESRQSTRDRGIRRRCPWRRDASRREGVFDDRRAT